MPQLRHFFRCKLTRGVPGYSFITQEAWVYGWYADLEGLGFDRCLSSGVIKHLYATFQKEYVVFEYLGRVTIKNELEEFTKLINTDDAWRVLRGYPDWVSCAFAKGKGDEMPWKVSNNLPPTLQPIVSATVGSFYVDVYKRKQSTEPNPPYCIVVDPLGVANVFVHEAGNIVPASRRLRLTSFDKIFELGLPVFWRSVWRMVSACRGDFGRIVFAPMMEQIISAFEQGEEGPHPLLQGE